MSSSRVGRCTGIPTETGYLNFLKDLNSYDLNVSITRLRDDFKSLASSYTTLSESEQEADAQQKALTKLVETHTDDLALAFTTLE